LPLVTTASNSGRVVRVTPEPTPLLPISSAIEGMRRFLDSDGNITSRREQFLTKDKPKGDPRMRAVKEKMLRSL